MEQAVHEFSIGQLARKSGYSVQTIRYYEETGLMPHPPRTGGGQRRYSAEHLKRLLFIRHARDLGFEMEAVRSLLGLASEPRGSCQGVNAITRQHLSSVEAKLARLTALREELWRMVQRCPDGRIADCRIIRTLASQDYASDA